MSDYIPFEIQAEILKRLPLKPLIQFRLVSKRWKSLIDSPGFIVSYAPLLDNRVILRYTDPDYDGDRVDRFLTFVDNDDDDSFVGQEFVFGPTIPDLVKKFEPIFTCVVGSSHGLLCFNITSWKRRVIEMVILWNPSLRRYVGIEQPCLFDLSTDGVAPDIGFGVCPVTFDPTIIRIECISRVPWIGEPWKVAVFTLSTGTWSILSANLPRGSVILRGLNVVIDRFLYWLAYDMLDGPSQSKFQMVSFDLTAKEFKEISLTDSLANQLSEIKSISKLRESLVLLAYHREFGEDVSLCSLWMMINDQQDANRSFTKLYNINLLPDVTIYSLLGFRKTGELILETEHNEGYKNAKLEMYNPNSERSTDLGIAGKRYTFFMCSYMETLLLLDESDGYIYSNSMQTNE